MIRRSACIATLVAALGIAVPAAAQAEETAHWYVGKHLLEPGQSVPISMKGKLTLYIGNDFAHRYRCAFSASGTIEGTDEGGTGWIEAAEGKGCLTEVGGSELETLKPCPKGKANLLARGLPWHQELTPDVKDVIEGVSLLPACGSESPAPPPAEGSTLAPTVTGGDLELAGFTPENFLSEENITVQGHLKVVAPGHQRVTALLRSAP